jgi:hypothetical protein
LSNLVRNTNLIYNSDPFTPRSVTISVTAADPAGVSTVTLWYDPPGAVGWQTKAMTRISGTSLSGTWRTSVTAECNWPTGSLSYYTVGVDTFQNSRQYPLPGIIGYPALQVEDVCLI